jgi:hypothetical protein
MEYVILQALIQQGCEISGGSLCTLWHWGYWIAFVVGIVGSAAAFFLSPPHSG